MQPQLPRPELAEVAKAMAETYLESFMDQTGNDIVAAGGSAKLTVFSCSGLLCTAEFYDCYGVPFSLVYHLGRFLCLLTIFFVKLTLKHICKCFH